MFYSVRRLVHAFLNTYRTSTSSKTLYAGEVTPVTEMQTAGRWTDSPMQTMSKDDQQYMIDFSPDRWGAGITEESNSISSGSPRRSRRTSKKVSGVKLILRVPVTPKSVLAELERRPTMTSLNGLPGKITILEAKLSLIQQTFAQEELRSLIKLLKNRLRYHEVDKSGVPYSQFFSRLDSTDDQKIKALCDKYALVKKPADIFVPEFPDEAVQIMSAYSAKVEELSGLKPRYFVIASESDFKAVYKKRDPILLVQSPFGFYYYILGAWDVEMLYLPEL